MQLNLAPATSLIFTYLNVIQFSYSPALVYLRVVLYVYTK